MLESVTKKNRKVPVFALLGCCASYVRFYRRFGTAYRSHRTAQFNHVLRVRNSIRRVIARKFFFLNLATTPSRPGPPHYSGFTITLRHIPFARAPLDE